MNKADGDPRTYAIIGAAVEVHRELGSGFLEPVYQEPLSVEFGLHAIPYEREKLLPIIYKERLLDTRYKPDFICFEDIIVELKALDAIGGNEEAQLINYLKISKFEVGLLINFGKKSLEFRRFANSKSAESA